MPGPAARLRALAPLGMAVLGLAAAGCGAQAAPAPAAAARSSGTVAAVTARSQVVSAVRSLYDQRLYGARISYATSLDGGYQPCPQPKSDIRFVGGTDLYPLHAKVGMAAYTGALTGALSRGGWTVQRQQSPVPASGPVSYYTVRKGGLAGDLYVVPGAPGTPHAVLGLHSGCFRPARRQTLTVRFFHMPLPHPGASG
jgi:hypothetical protein